MEVVLPHNPLSVVDGTAGPYPFETYKCSANKRKIHSWVKWNTENSKTHSKPKTYLTILITGLTCQQLLNQKVSMTFVANLFSLNVPKVQITLMVVFNLGVLASPTEAQSKFIEFW